MKPIDCVASNRTGRFVSRVWRDVIFSTRTSTVASGCPHSFDSVGRYSATIEFGQCHRLGQAVAVIPYIFCKCLLSSVLVWFRLGIRDTSTRPRPLHAENDHRVRSFRGQRVQGFRGLSRTTMTRRTSLIWRGSLVDVVGVVTDCCHSRSFRWLTFRCFLWFSNVVPTSFLNIFQVIRLPILRNGREK